MSAYIIRRLLLMVPTLFLVTVIIFSVARLIPGDVLDVMVAEMAVDSGMGAELNIEVLRHAMGLDVPVHIQYGQWIGIIPNQEGTFSGVFQGNLGRSLWTQEPIMDELRRRLPVSFELGLLAKITALLIALPIGTYSAIRQDTPGDYGGRTFAILCISVPSFWLGTIVMVYPSVYWHWSPPVQYIPLVENPIGNLGQFIIPAVILGMVTSGTLMRMTRTMMLEVLRQDYIRTAWSKGLRERTVVLRHATKNALIPVVTIIGMQIPILIGGSVIMESIFCLPGVGLYMIEAITKRDYPVISAINLMIASFVLVANLVVDLAYGWLDPRIVYK